MTSQGLYRAGRLQFSCAESVSPTSSSPSAYHRLSPESLLCNVTYMGRRIFLLPSLALQRRPVSSVSSSAPALQQGITRLVRIGLISQVRQHCTASKASTTMHQN